MIHDTVHATKAISMFPRAKSKFVLERIAKTNGGDSIDISNAGSTRARSG